MFLLNILILIVKKEFTIKKGLYVVMEEGVIFGQQFTFGGQ